jgi:lipopolysaccharide transport system ATP-binding protein
MSRLAIRAESLGKRFNRHGANAYRGMHETIERLVRSPLQPFRSRNAGDGSIWALRDVSFEVQQGEAVGVLGSNGAGKSVMLKILSRVTAPTEGGAEICGNIAPLLEVGAGFHPELTGRENVYLNGAILGMSRGQIHRKFDEIVGFAEMADFIDTPVKLYSSGMRMRLAFSVAAHLEPEILLIDEALAVGDASFRAKCRKKIQEFIAQGCTLVLVSHDTAIISDLCDRAIWLDRGRMAGDGDVTSVLDRYRSGASK